MSGVQEYNDKFTRQAEQAIRENADISYLEDFYISMIDNGSSTKYQYIRHAISFARFINNKKPEDITLADYSRFLASINNTSAAHQKATYAAMKKLSSFLGEYGLGKDCVTKKIKTKQKESIETIKKRENAVLTQDQIDELINHVKETNPNPMWRQRDVAIISVLRGGGNRRAAIQKLDMDDIDFEEGSIDVTEKGGKPRKVYLDKDTMHELRKWMDYREAMHLKTNAVFISNRCKRMDLCGFNYIFKKYGEIFPTKIMSPHKLRASYCTALYNKTHDVYFVQQAMGHSDPSVTEIYIRGQKNATKKARDILFGDNKGGSTI